MVVMGVEYHKDIIAHIQLMAAEKTISREDLDLVLFTDSVEDVVAHIGKYAESQALLSQFAPHKPNWLLGEESIKKKPA